ncbi:hypothetical protein FOXYSP1_18856 [Fusarium oxysporum f. sp. phaseoli]
MRLFSTLMILAIIGLAQAWSINFFAEKGDKMKRVSANGTKRGNCINLRSDYDWVTTSITFYPQTPAWPDPNGYTAYSKANCKGTAYYGVEGQQNPKRRFRSYRMTSRRAPPSTTRTRNTIRVSPASESSRPGASGQDHTPSSIYDSTTAISEKNTLFLPQELKLGGPSDWEQYCPAQKAILRINGLEDAVFGDYPPEEQQTMDQKIRAAKAAVSIRGNCTGEALSQLVGIENPQEMFNLLQAYCIGTGPVLLQTTLYQFIRIKTSSYEKIPQFNVDFERLVKLLLEQKEPISDTLKKVTARSPTLGASANTTINAARSH